MYRSPTHGLLTLEEVFSIIKKSILNDPDSEYRIMVGCDSQQHKDHLAIVSAIIVYRVGKGATYYHERTMVPRSRVSIREKVYLETTTCIEIATALKDTVLKDDELPVDTIVHLDIGKKGKTSAYVKELVSLVESYGFEVCIKDESRRFDKNYEYPVAASCVADRYSK